ncbi:MAG: universal stress protein [Polyangiales bacterium]
MAEIKRILSPVDFSETSDHALRYAVDLASKLGAEMHVVHVYQLPMYALPDGGVLAGPDVAAGIMDQAQKRMKELTKELDGEGVRMKTHVIEGMPHREIVRMADEIEADLIIMGTHGRSGLSHLLLGSVAERVVRTSTHPVLTVRHPEHGKE